MKKITMKDIARMAGVSQPVVSDVLNRKNTMASKATQDRVRKIARQLNYHPNQFAQSLKTGRTGCLGVSTLTNRISFLKRFEQSYLALTYSGIGSVIGDEKYKLIFHEVDTREASIELAQKRMVDGLIFVLFSEAIEKFYDLQKQYLESIAVPYVCIHSLNHGLGSNSVGADCVQGGALGTGHLLDLGYRGIGCVTVKVHSHHCLDLVLGFRNAHKERGVPLDENQILYVENYGEAQGYALAEQLILDHRMPRALFVTDDSMARGIQKKCLEAGMSIPGDVALVGFGDEEATYNEYCDLTCVRQPAREKGEQATRLLLDLINHPEKQKNEYHTVLKTDLVIRKSCGGK